jgi:CHASE3 domain sensor protein
VVDIWGTILQVRLDQNKYMLYKDEKYINELQQDAKHLNTRFDDLNAITESPINRQRIADARKAMDY